MKIKQLIAALLFLIISSTSIVKAAPDEGMWLPMFIKRLNAEDIAKQGCKLTPDEIYSVNNNSLKDAIVWLRFCTGEIISDNGLMLTNHHCAYGAIQSHTTEQNNYLDNGFWAKSFKEELPIAGQTASILVRMEDVTAKVLKDVKPETTQAERNKLTAEASRALQKEFAENGRYEVIVRDMFNGNEYYMFIYETFKDIRLVGAPPQSIGKFGGDTDNWMWPRHTGDFSLFRIYADKDGKPAEYSPDNVPYKPRHFLPISLKGYKEGDYAMILGFPGRTNRYATSPAMRLIMEKNNPTLVKLFGKKLETWKKDMNSDLAIRIKLSSKYASLANSWKYYIGQNEGLKKLNVIEERQKEESAFLAWANAKPEYKEKYAGIFDEYNKAIKGYENIVVQSLYLNFAGRSSDAMRMIMTLSPLMAEVNKKPVDALALDKAFKSVNEAAKDFYKDYSTRADKNVMREMLLMYINDIPASQLPPVILDITKGKGKTNEEKVINYVENVFAKSFLVDEARFNAFATKPDKKKFDKDPLVILNNGLTEYQTKNFSAAQVAFNSKTDELKRVFMEGYMLFKGNTPLYPDANSTLRMTYGTIMSYGPRDAVHFDHFTTSAGILEKYQPGDSEFDVPARLIELLQKKDFGRYGQNGELVVAFLSNNDITGGNSGSPVINAKGELIGCAFDGNWEAMTGDLVFDPKLKRTISVDIRYVLFIMDKYANAQNLIQEMKIVE
jgi:hypothetical protein